MWKYTSSLCIAVLLSVAVLAQEKTRADTTRNKFLPTGLRVGTDVLSLIQSQTSQRFDGWEVNADIDFTRYYFTVDYGSWRANHPLKNGYYENEGNYFRAGVDINFLLKDPDRNMFFLGGRYGRSGYADSVLYTIADDRYGTIVTDAVNRDVTARWFEMTGGLRVKIWKWLWMGYTARFKFALKTKGDGAMRSYDVPGYGLTIKPSTWGFNYQVFVRLPVRKQK